MRLSAYALCYFSHRVEILKARVFFFCFFCLTSIKSKGKTSSESEIKVNKLGKILTIHNEIKVSWKPVEIVRELHKILHNFTNQTCNKD